MDLRAVPVPAENLRVREVDDETVFLTESGREVLSLNAVGSFIWRQIDGNHSLRDIVDIVCQEYEVGPERAEADLRTFVAELEEHQLLRLAPADA
jgi:hypothetical protein